MLTIPLSYLAPRLMTLLQVRQIITRLSTLRGWPAVAVVSLPILITWGASPGCLSTVRRTWAILLTQYKALATLTLMAHLVGRKASTRLVQAPSSPGVTASDSEILSNTAL